MVNFGWENSYLDLKKRRNEDLKRFIPEVKITKHMKEVIETTYNPFFSSVLPYRVFYMGTADDTGNPNVTLISFAKVIGDDKIMIPDGALLKARMNLETNPMLSLTVLSYRKFELYGSLGTRILSKLMGDPSPGSSPLGKIRMRIFGPFFNRVKSKTPSMPLRISPLPYYDVVGWEFKGESEYVREGQQFEEVREFGKKLFGPAFELYGLVLLHVREVYDAFSGTKIQGE